LEALFILSGRGDSFQHILRSLFAGSLVRETDSFALRHSPREEQASLLPGAAMPFTRSWILSSYELPETCLQPLFPPASALFPASVPHLRACQAWLVREVVPKQKLTIGILVAASPLANLRIARLHARATLEQARKCERLPETTPRPVGKRLQTSSGNS